MTSLSGYFSNVRLLLSNGATYFALNWKLVTASLWLVQEFADKLRLDVFDCWFWLDHWFFERRSHCIKQKAFQDEDNLRLTDDRFKTSKTTSNIKFNPKHHLRKLVSRISAKVCRVTQNSASLASKIKNFKNHQYQLNSSLPNHQIAENKRDINNH